MGYVDPLVSGEVKEMKSSYLPKNTNRGPAYPKTIKQYNDLYLPYSVDLIAPDNASDVEGASLNLILRTNFGDFQHAVSVVGGTSAGGTPAGGTPAGGTPAGGTY